MALMREETNGLHLADFRFFTAARMKITAFWDITPGSLVEVDRRFRASLSSVTGSY